MIIHKLSQFFQPKLIVPPGRERGAETTSISQKLLHNLGLVRSNAAGTNVVFPLALRTVEKLKKLIREELQTVGAQEISMPALIPLKLFNKTERDNLPELFKLKDRHGKQLVLSPTHEEAICSLLGSIVPSYKSLPLFLYQIGSKYRDEIKPRFGLMRSREFMMKDLYCFEASVQASRTSYNNVNECYRRIFQRLQVPFCCVEGSTGEIGGSLSHEFHILSNVGEDNVSICNDCGHEENALPNTSSCGKCKGTSVNHHGAIEVGHSFLLGTRYTKPLNAVFLGPDQSHQYLEMSCHGIGLSRLLAAGVEVLSSPQAIRWPRQIAPFSLCIIPPKAGSKEEKNSISITELQSKLAQLFLDDIVVDDRKELTIGKRLAEAMQMGYPYLVVIGKASLEQIPMIEIHDTLNGSVTLLQPSEVLNVLKEKMANA